MEYITIDANEFLKGESSSPEVADGGFSPESSGLNPTYLPGVMYGTAAYSQKGTPTGKIIASAQDPGISSSGDQVLISDDHKVYTFDGTTLSNSATLSSKQFAESNANMVAFNGYFIAPTKPGDQDLVRITGAGAIDTESYWQTTLGKSALDASATDRPLIVFQTDLYIGDSNKIHRIQQSGTADEAIVTLDTYNRITAFGIDPSAGQMLVGLQRMYQNASGTKTGQSFIGTYDGTSNKLSRLVPVQGKIVAFFHEAGTVYVVFQNNIGVWTGSGVRFLKKLRNASLDFTQLLKRDKFASAGHIMFFVDDTDIVAYGEIIPGHHSFWRIHTASTTISAIWMVNATTLAFALDGYVRTIDLSSKSINATLVSNRYYFPSKVDVKEIEVSYYDAVNADLDTSSAYIINEENITKYVAVKNTTDSAKHVLKTPFKGPSTSSFVFKLIQGSGAYGWRRIRIGYLPAGKK